MRWKESGYTGICILFVIDSHNTCPRNRCTCIALENSDFSGFIVTKPANQNYYNFYNYYLCDYWHFKMGGKQGRKKQIKPMPEFPVPYSAKTSLEVFFFF